MTENKTNKYPKIQCNSCKDIIQSRYSGEMVGCKCSVESSKREVDLLNKIKAAVGEDFLGEWDEGSRYIKQPWFVENDMGHFVRCCIYEAIGTGIFIDSTPYYSRYGGASSFTVIDPGSEDGWD